MARLFNSFLAFLTLAPIAAWLAALLLRTLLRGVFGCRIEPGATHPCTALGADISGTAAAIGGFAAEGLWMLWPLVLCAGMLWAILAGSRLFLSNTG